MRTGDVAGARWTILAVALQVRQLQCHSTELLLARRLKAVYVYGHAWQNLFAYKALSGSLNRHHGFLAHRDIYQGQHADGCAPHDGVGETCGSGNGDSDIADTRV